MIRIAVIMTLWKRDALERSAMRRVPEAVDGCEFVRVAVGSERKASRERAESCGWNYIEHKNQPLSDKTNAALPFVREADVSGLVVMGSDDFLNRAYWERLPGLVLEGVQAYSLRGLYVLEQSTARLVWCPKVRSGVGMYVGRETADRYSWKLWEPGLERGLDRSLHDRIIRRTSPWVREWHVDRAGIVPLDVKGTQGYSINDFEKTMRATNSTQPVPEPRAFLDRHFPGLAAELIPESTSQS